jgi:hypothetical protein
MSTVADPVSPRSESGWFTRSEAWLDDRGKGAWIAAMVLGFIFFWPLGLALLAYMIWSKRMFSHSCRGYGRHHDFHHAHREFREQMRQRAHSARAAMRPSGNTAFDEYKSETLRRLMDEQEQFEAFLDRLRAAKDKQEFDAFMDERANAAREASAEADEGDEAEEAK